MHVPGIQSVPRSAQPPPQWHVAGVHEQSRDTRWRVYLSSGEQRWCRAEQCPAGGGGELDLTDSSWYFHAMDFLFSLLYVNC